MTWHLMHRPSVALLGRGIGILAGAGLLAGVAWWVSNGFFAGDTLTYWLAGQRVDVGHEIYTVAPDDPWLFDIRPHGLLSPPLVVVPWRVLQSLPAVTGMVIWWVAMAVAAFWAAAVVLIGTRGWAGVLALPLVPAYTLMIGVGNVDGAVLAGLVGAWLLRDHPRALGLLVAALVSVKLTPAVLVVWLVATRRLPALAWAIGAGVALAALTMAMLGPGIFGDYLGVMASVGSTRPWALVLLSAMLAAVLLLGRRWPAVAFALAVVAIPIGSPSAAGHTWALALAAVAPGSSWVHRPILRLVVAGRRHGTVEHPVQPPSMADRATMWPNVRVPTPPKSRAAPRTDPIGRLRVDQAGEAVYTAHIGYTAAATSEGRTEPAPSS